MRPLPPEALAGFALIVGACLGSFLNVVIARLPRGLSIVRPGSHCFTCGAPVRWFDNIPIVSWFVLRGRCRDCGARFSFRCVIVEAGFALVCGLAVWRHGLTISALREVALMGFLIPLAMIDLDTWLLPRALTIPGVGVGIAIAAMSGVPALKGSLFAGAVGFTALALVGFIAERILKKEALGAGDPWLLALIGAFLGMRGLAPTVFLASFQGVAIGGAVLLVRRRRGIERPPAQDGWTPPPTAIPFGPFLALAAAELLYFPHFARYLFPF